MVEVKGLSRILILMLLGVAGSRADGDSAFFETHIRPLFAAHCYECHSERAEKIKGGLRLDIRAGWETGGDHGPPIVPGDPENSLLLRAVSYEDPDLQMPPDGRLPATEREHLREWIARGAPDPREGQVTASSDEETTAEAMASHWAFEPIGRVAPPAGLDSTWPRSPVDRFVEKARSEAGLKPADDADVHTLLRRLYVTLIGLVPAPEQIEDFLAEDSPDRWGRLSDRLLASPRYGEHWGRHWLDVTRFAESSGGGRSLMFKNAWRFRDYVIDAFNADVPFDTLAMEHLAGDVLFQREDREMRRQRERIIGSGFLALGPTNYELQDKELLRMEVVDEQIDTVGRAFLGMTLGCARCHDHKFDPIPTEEYYALAGIFRSTKTLIPGNVSGYVETPLPGPQNDVRQEWEQERDARKQALASAMKEDKERVAELKTALKEFEKSAPPVSPKAMSVREESEEELGDSHVHIRGEIRSLGARVPRGFLSVATPKGMPVRPRLEEGESGRLALARWLTSPEHPLTGRVYVNRLWHHVMGVGLVRTVDNFGKTGEKPSHPELLDYLARDFTGPGDWSSKRLIRMLVSSRSFQLGRTPKDEKGPELDPENRLLWRAHERILPAESLRDVMLQVSGELDLTAGGLTIEKFSEYDNGYEFGDFKRRAVYAPAFRNARLEILNLFDAANPSMVQGRRSQTTLATQALFMMNASFVMERASRVAERLVKHPASHRDKLRRVYLRILGRPPSEEESMLAETFLTEFTSEEAWAILAHNLFASLDFRCLN